MIGVKGTIRCRMWSRRGLLGSLRPLRVCLVGAVAVCVLIKPSEPRCKSQLRNLDWKLTVRQIIANLVVKNLPVLLCGSPDNPVTTKLKNKPSALVEVFDSSESDISWEILESQTGKKQLWLESIVQRADTRNRNGRVYPRALLKREVESFQKHIAEGTSYGEADHPQPGKAPSVLRQAILWKSMKMDEDGAVRARGIVMETDAGKQVRAILDAGGAVGSSSRGRGSVSLKAAGTVPVTNADPKEQLEVVNEDYRMRTVDIVIDQSVEDAVSSRIKYEQHLIEREFGESLQEEETMTLKELKEEHPEVYAALLAEAKADAGVDEAAIQAALGDMLAEKEAEIRASIMEELEDDGALLSEEKAAMALGKDAFIAVVLEAAKEAGLLEDHVLAEGEAAEVIKAQKDEIASLNKANATLEAANAKLRERDAASEVEEAVSEFSKDHVLSEALTESLLGECSDMDTFNAKKDAIKARFDTLAESISAPKGKGKTYLNEDDNPAPGAMPKNSDKVEESGTSTAKKFLKTLAG